MTALGTDTGLADQVVREAHEAGDFEGAMNAVRRLHREQTFRIGMHVVTGRTTAEQAGLTYTSLADACMKGLAPAALSFLEAWPEERLALADRMEGLCGLLGEGPVYPFWARKVGEAMAA